MVDLRKIMIIFIIAVLFTILVNTSIEAIKPSPKYEDFCMMDKYGPAPVFTAEQKNMGISCPVFTEPSTDERKECASSRKGNIEYEYNSKGCPTKWVCNTCNNGWMQANREYQYMIFLVCAGFALLAISLGLYLPVEKNKLHEWVATGFLLGGLITLFVGTVRGFEGLGRFVKPAVIALELALVIYIAYKKLGDKSDKKDKSRKKKGR